MTTSLEVARRCLAALDLTRLGDADDRAAIEALCASAATPFGTPAAVCVHPEWIATCRERLAALGIAHVHVATVVNFPDGSPDARRAAADTRRAIAAGADEIDVVFPYRALLAGDAHAGDALVRACRDACGERARLKVILETGELGTEPAIRAAAHVALEAGADFLKTSTGKVRVGATPSAARTLLEAIRDAGGRAGFKVSGGIRTLADARVYFALADTLLGAGWATAARFRIGASVLLVELVAVLGCNARALD